MIFRALACLLLLWPTIAGGSPPAAGDLLPDLSTPVVVSDKDASYLGTNARPRTFWIVPSRPLRFRQIPADVLVLFLFNRHCPSCHPAAPVLAQAFNLLQASALAGRVRCIGIGIGNSHHDAMRFASRHALPFPLIPDPAFALHRALGSPDLIPHTIIVRRTPTQLRVGALLPGIPSAPETILQAVEAVLHDRTYKVLTAPPAAANRFLQLDLTPQQRLERVSACIRNTLQPTQHLQSVTTQILDDGTEVYQGIASGAGSREIIYGVIISRPPPCDIAHGIHCIITFSHDGLITGFAPIHLTRYGNLACHDHDIASMR